MYDDARIADGLSAMMRECSVPQVSLGHIRRRMLLAAPKTARNRRFSPAMVAVAAVALLVLGLPVISPAFVQSVEAQIAAILHWSPPPAPPASIVSALRSTAGSLAQAQSRVAFTIVRPMGLPNDVTSERITTMPGAEYSNSTHQWKVGSPDVWFKYNRARGVSFLLQAAAFDAREGPPSKYMFEDDGVRNGHPVLVRHDRYVWRNGNQVITAIAGTGISASEIVAIRSAMRGIPIAGVWPPRDRATKKMYRLP